MNVNLILLKVHVIPRDTEGFASSDTARGGEDAGDIPGLGLTHGNYYYWPSTTPYPEYVGVIDDEEFTAKMFVNEGKMYLFTNSTTGNKFMKTSEQLADGLTIALPKRTGVVFFYETV